MKVGDVVQLGACVLRIKKITNDNIILEGDLLYINANELILQKTQEEPPPKLPTFEERQRRYNVCEK